MIEVEGMGEKCVENLVGWIEEWKEKCVEGLLFGVGIGFLGWKGGKSLGMDLGDIDELKEGRKEELLEVDEMGEKMGDGVVT